MPEGTEGRLAKLRGTTSRAHSLLGVAREVVGRERAALVELEARRAALEEAQVLAQEVAQVVQEAAHQRIAELATRCLQAVFPEPYELRCRFERRRGRTEAHLRFECRGHDVDPLEECGGGLVDVAAFALRLACLLLSRPRPRPLLVLDEAFRFVSAVDRPRLRELLGAVSLETGVQLVLVTHSRALRTGLVHRLRRGGRG